jgi:hypothetical protein
MSLTRLDRLALSTRDLLVGALAFGSPHLLLYLLRRFANTCWLPIIDEHRAFYGYASGSVEDERNISGYISAGRAYIYGAYFHI